MILVVYVCFSIIEVFIYNDTHSHMITKSTEYFPFFLAHAPRSISYCPIPNFDCQKNHVYVHVLIKNLINIMAHYNAVTCGQFNMLNILISYIFPSMLFNTILSLLVKMICLYHLN